MFRVATHADSGHLSFWRRPVALSFGMVPPMPVALHTRNVQLTPPEPGNETPWRRNAPAPAEWTPDPANRSRRR
jgi:hypothetical protein